MKYLKLLPLLFLCGWTPSSGDNTKLNTAERVILEAYGAALAILPAGAQASIQKTLGVWVRDNSGGSIWGTINVSGSFPYQNVNSTVLNSSAFVYDCTFSVNGGTAYFQDNYGGGGVFRDMTCSRTGFVADINGNVWPSYLSNITSTNSIWDGIRKMIYTGDGSGIHSIAAHCIVGRAYASALTRNYVSGDYWNDVLFYINGSNCQINSFSELNRTFLNLPSSQALQDTAGILSTLKAAQAQSLALAVPNSTSSTGGYTLTASTSIAAAIAYIEQGVSVDGPIGQTTDLVPSTFYSGVSSSVYSNGGSSVSVNVSVNVSTAEIVNRLDSINSFLTEESTETVDSLSSWYNGLIGSAIDSVDTSTFTTVLNQFTVPIASTTWQPCFTLAWSGLWGAPDQEICLSDWPNWNGVILPLIQFALVFGTALWCFIYMWEGN